MGNNIKKEYNQEKDIKLDITLNKVCYMPGEKINGSLDIQPKPENTEKILNDTLVIIKITQFQRYTYLEHNVGDDDSKLEVVNQEEDIFKKFFFYGL